MHERTVFRNVQIINAVTGKILVQTKGTYIELEQNIVHIITCQVHEFSNRGIPKDIFWVEM